MEECYLEHFSSVAQSVGQVLSGADKETIVHEVFLRLLSDENLRNGFQGGSFQAWLTTMARHRAIDYLRRHRREILVDPDFASMLAQGNVEVSERKTEARSVIERFRREQLPQKWSAVFDARFLQQLSQREAAARLGIRRTTLAYQEGRIRVLLRRFLLRREKR